MQAGIGETLRRQDEVNEEDIDVLLVHVYYA